MTSPWTSIARRAVAGLGARPGELVLVNAFCERDEALYAMLLALEQAGATPLVELLPAHHQQRLLNEVGLEHLRAWHRRRLEGSARADRILHLTDGGLERAAAPAEAWAAWIGATQKLVEVHDERRLPTLVVAVPSARQAARLGMSPEQLDALVLPALDVPLAEQQAEIARVLDAAGAGAALTLRTGTGCELRCEQGPRAWLPDDGLIDERDVERGAICSNLPAGSLYTTVLESSAAGTLFLAEAAGAREAVLHFERGSVVRVEAAEDAGRFEALLERHDPGARRISHIGVALNPRLRCAPVGWTLVDEHIHGALFLALGENRYMGGENASTLNEDFALAGASLLAGGRTLVEAGRLAV